MCLIFPNQILASLPGDGIICFTNRLIFSSPFLCVGTNNRKFCVAEHILLLCDSAVESRALEPTFLQCKHGQSHPNVARVMNYSLWFHTGLLNCKKIASDAISFPYLLILHSVLTQQ